MTYYYLFISNIFIYYLVLVYKQQDEKWISMADHFFIRIPIKDCTDVSVINSVSLSVQN